VAQASVLKVRLLAAARTSDDAKYSPSNTATSAEITGDDEVFWTAPSSKQRPNVWQLHLQRVEGTSFRIKSYFHEKKR
jgi:hypothetical protein